MVAHCQWESYGQTSGKVESKYKNTLGWYADEHACTSHPYSQQLKQFNHYTWVYMVMINTCEDYAHDMSPQVTRIANYWDALIIQIYTLWSIWNKLHMLQVTRNLNWKISNYYAPLTAASHYTWRHTERDCVSNHRRFDSLLNCLFSRRSKKT